jgi:hypothetical protein
MIANGLAIDCFLSFLPICAEMYFRLFLRVTTLLETVLFER